MSVFREQFPPPGQVAPPRPPKNVPGSGKKFSNSSKNSESFEFCLRKFGRSEKKNNTFDTKLLRFEFQDISYNGTLHSDTFGHEPYKPYIPSKSLHNISNTMSDRVVYAKIVTPDKNVSVREKLTSCQCLNCRSREAINASTLASPPDYPHPDLSLLKFSPNHHPSGRTLPSVYRHNLPRHTNPPKPSWLKKE